MNIRITNTELEIIRIALRSAEYLIIEEYQTLCNDDLKAEYDSTLENLNKALKLVEQK